MDSADSCSSFASSAYMALQGTASFERQQSSLEAAAAGEAPHPAAAGVDSTAAAGDAASAEEEGGGAAAAGEEEEAAAGGSSSREEEGAAAAAAPGEGPTAGGSEREEPYVLPEAALRPIPPSAFTAAEPAAPLLAGERMTLSCADTPAATAQDGAAATESHQGQTPGTAASAETAAGAATQQQQQPGAGGGAASGKRGGENRPVEIASNVTKLPAFDKNINASIFVSTSTFELASVPPQEVTEQLLSSSSSSYSAAASTGAAGASASSPSSSSPSSAAPAAAASPPSGAATPQGNSAAAGGQEEDVKDDEEKTQQEHGSEQQQLGKEQQQGEEEADDEEPQQATGGASKKKRPQQQDDAAGAAARGGAAGASGAEETAATAGGVVPKKKIKTEVTERSSDRMSRSTSLPSGAAAAATADRPPTAADEARTRKREEDALKRELQREAESKPFKLPTCCSWFDETCISPVEEDLLPTLFTGSLLSPEEREQRYLQLRQAILALYRANPTRHLSFSDCRRVIAADAALLLRLHSFLDYWGIINFQADPSTIPSALAKRKEFLLRDFQALSQQEASLMERESPAAQSSRGRAAGSGTDELLHPAEGRGPWRCVVCGKICVYSYYVLRPACVTGVSLGVLDRCVWCLRCFAEGRFPPVLNSRQFLKVDVPVMAAEDKEGGWTLAQTERLIEAIERYKDNWTEVAAHVGGGRTAQMCVERFIQLPIKEPFFSPAATSLGTSCSASTVTDFPSQLERSGADGREPFLGFANPLLSLLAFLASSVHPSVAAAAAKAALDRAVELGTLRRPAAAARGGGAAAETAAEDAEPAAGGKTAGGAAAAVTKEEATADEDAAAEGRAEIGATGAGVEETQTAAGGAEQKEQQQAAAEDAAAAGALGRGKKQQQQQQQGTGSEEEAEEGDTERGSSGGGAAAGRETAAAGHQRNGAASGAAAAAVGEEQQQPSSSWGSGGGLVADRDLEAASSTALAAGAASAAELALAEEAEAEKLLREVVQLQLQQLECKMNCMQILEKRIARSKLSLEKNFRELLREHQDAAAELERTKALAAAAAASTTMSAAAATVSGTAP